MPSKQSLTLGLRTAADVSRRTIRRPSTDSCASIMPTTVPRAQKDDVIYEMNVRGMTANDSSIPQAERGTYAGAAQKAAYLQSLGVTAVELQPVQEVQNDQDNIYEATHGGAAPPNGDTGWNSGQYYKDNYWGYMTLAYFAPDRRYASNKAPGGPTAEFQAMVKTFHDVGIKIYMDVVYNHTGEGAAIPNTGSTTAYPLYGMRGLDNSTYYELAVNGQGTVNAGYYDANGAGPDYNTYNHAAQNLIVDSLYYWSTTMGVDGFRFDEAPILGNACESDQRSPQTPNCPAGTAFHFSTSDPKTALVRILSEPLLATRPAVGGSGLDLIAEPNAAGGHVGDNVAQQGNFPTGFLEWNHSLFRQGGMLYELMPNMTDFLLLPLIERFAQMLAAQPLFAQMFGAI